MALPTHRVAVIQMHPKPMQLEANFERAADYIRAAARQHAHLAVLPEYHLLNWVPTDPKFNEACSQWQTYLQKYQDLAKECNINVVPGTIIELHDAGTPRERLLNVAYFISNTGEILGKYVKKNLWGSIERDHLTSSTHAPHEVFDTPLGKVGLLICWDLAFPEAFRELIDQGAKLIIIPTFWTLNDCSEDGRAINPTSEVLFIDSILTARCFENTCGKVLHHNFVKSDSNIHKLYSSYIRQRRRPARQRIYGYIADLHAIRWSNIETRKSCRGHGGRRRGYEHLGNGGRKLSSAN